MPKQNRIIKTIPFVRSIYVAIIDSYLHFIKTFTNNRIELSKKDILKYTIANLRVFSAQEQSEMFEELKEYISDDKEGLDWFSSNYQKHSFPIINPIPENKKNFNITQDLLSVDASDFKITNVFESSNFLGDILGIKKISVDQLNIVNEENNTQNINFIPDSGSSGIFLYVKKGLNLLLPLGIKRRILALAFFLTQENKPLQKYFGDLLNEISAGKINLRGSVSLKNRKKLIEITESYPSIVNNGYRHIEKTIDIIHSLNLNPNHSIIDVGGADGTVSIMLSKAFPNAKIYTFEPIQASFQQLSQNTNTYPNIQINNLALGNKAQKLQMQIAERITSSSLFDINEEIEDKYLATNIKKKSEEEIEVKRLDDIFDDNQIFNLIKLDVQGYELEVLKGGIEVLKQTKIVLIEMQNHDIYSKAPKYYDLDAFLREHHFILYDIVPSIRRDKKLYEWDSIYLNQTL